MLAESEIMCFLATTNAERAWEFYENTLGLKFLEELPFAIVFDANGTMLRIQKTESHTPLKTTSLGWKVTDIHEEIRALNAKGVRFERYARLPQDAAGVWTSPDGARVAWFKDPDGNVLSMTQWPQT